MAEAHSNFSPKVYNCKLYKLGAELFLNSTFYRSVIGALQYVTLTTQEISLLLTTSGNLCPNH